MDRKESDASALHAQNLIYPRNQWYVAAGMSEIGRAPLGRRVLERDIVLYRTEAGEAVAMADWCPHRGFRLSKSRLVGDGIECGYHGMRFDSGGNCVHIPSQESIPAKMKVSTYPLIECGPFAWVWLGDEDKADPALIPTAAFELEDPRYHSRFLRSAPVAANAAVGFENAIDITHASLLHPGILDGDDWELMQTPDELETVSPTVVQTTKRFGKVAVKGYLARTMGVAEGAVVDRIRVSREYLPALHTSIDSYYDADDASILLARRLRYVAFTPQDVRSSYVFAAYSGTFPYDEAADKVGIEALRQDLVAIHMTQKYFDEAGADFKERSIRADRAAMLTRRIIARLAAEEAAEGASDALQPPMPVADRPAAPSTPH
ncbi:MAG: Rieske (2Fe-2S) domain protein [Bradyrhizobium sp.]|nr:Rieske (2Fe-2S) domain protein [Bradyrhizobium sp.]